MHILRSANLFEKISKIIGLGKTSKLLGVVQANVDHLLHTRALDPVEKAGGCGVGEANRCQIDAGHTSTPQPQFYERCPVFLKTPPSSPGLDRRRQAAWRAARKDRCRSCPTYPSACPRSADDRRSALRLGFGGQINRVSAAPVRLAGNDGNPSDHAQSTSWRSGISSPRRRRGLARARTVQSSPTARNQRHHRKRTAFPSDARPVLHRGTHMQHLPGAVGRGDAFAGSIWKPLSLRTATPTTRRSSEPRIGVTNAGAHWARSDLG